MNLFTASMKHLHAGASIIRRIGGRLHGDAVTQRDGRGPGAPDMLRQTIVGHYVTTLPDPGPEQIA